MSFFCIQNSRNDDKGYKKLSTSSNAKPLRRLIYKLGDSSGENSKPVEQDHDHTNQAGQQSDHDTRAAVLPGQQNKASALEARLPRFGPCYGKDIEAIKTAKEIAWTHVLDNTPDEGQSSIRGAYTTAMKRIEKEAKDSYAPTVVSGLKTSEFRSKMITDGCFFLQAALSILGGADLLKYPEQHIYFGNHKDKDNSMWIEAMFFVGNQIPCIVLRELMKQSFFQKVIEQGKAKGRWSLPQHDLPKMLLYLLVVLPELGEISKWQKFKRYISREKEEPRFREEPSDLLHAFHCLVLGPGCYDPMDWDSEDDDDVGIDIDLEAAGAENYDKTSKFPSATELEQSGIKLKKADLGIREIHFKKKYFLFGRLYVPQFTFDANTERMLRFLKNYEIAQKLGKNEREVAAYICFMRDLIQTRKDVKILVDRRILYLPHKNHQDKFIKTKINHQDKLPRMLRRICSSKEIVSTQNLHLTRTKVQDYKSPPWHLLSLALFLTVVQTVFTVLGYFLPRN